MKKGTLIALCAAAVITVGAAAAVMIGGGGAENDPASLMMGGGSGGGGEVNAAYDADEMRDMWEEENRDQERDPWKEMEPEGKQPGKIDEKDFPVEGDDSYEGPYFIMMNDTHSYSFDLGDIHFPYKMTLMTLLQNSGQSASGSPYKGFIYLSLMTDVEDLRAEGLVDAGGLNQVMAQSNKVSIELLPYSQDVRDELNLPDYMNTHDRGPLLEVDRDGVLVNEEEARGRDTYYKPQGKDNNEFYPTMEFDYYAKFTVEMNYIYLNAMDMSITDGRDIHNFTMGKGTSSTVDFEFVLRVNRVGERAIIDLLEKQTPKFNHHPFNGKFLSGYKADVDDFKDEVIKKRNEQLDQFEKEADRVNEETRKSNEDELRSGMSEDQYNKLMEAMERERQMTAEHNRYERERNTFTGEDEGDVNVNVPPAGSNDNSNNSGGLSFGGMNHGIVDTPSVGAELPDSLKDSVPVPSAAEGISVVNAGGVVTLTYKTGLTIEELKTFYKDLLSGLTSNPYSPQDSALYSGTLAGYETVTVVFSRADGQTTVTAMFMA